MNSLSICTEELPAKAELKFILGKLHHSCGPTDGIDVSSIEPVMNAGKWDASFRIECNVPDTEILLYLVKGTGAFVDYIVFDHLNPTQESKPVLLVESTKTTDKDSRNTSVNQRFTKFATARQYYPDCPMVLFYNTKQNHSTCSGKFGLQLLKTYGIGVSDINGCLLEDIPVFTCIEDVIQCKNAIATKAHNVAVKIRHVSKHHFEISAKLCKGKTAMLNNDPNIGYITGICNVMHMFDPLASFTVMQHGITEVKSTKSKFWYANRSYILHQINFVTPQEIDPLKVYRHLSIWGMV